MSLWQKPTLKPTTLPERLAYDELLADQLTLALVRQTQRDRKGQALKGTGALQDA